MAIWFRAELGVSASIKIANRLYFRNPVRALTRHIPAIDPWSNYARRSAWT